MSITRNDVKLLRESLEVALAHVELDTGLVPKIGTISYDPNSARVKITFDLRDTETGTVLTEGARWLDSAHADMPDRYPARGEVVRVNGKRYRIVEYVTRRPKYPYVGERESDGKRFKLRAVDVQRGMAQTRKNGP